MDHPPTLSLITLLTAKLGLIKYSLGTYVDRDLFPSPADFVKESSIFIQQRILKKAEEYRREDTYPSISPCLM